MNIHLLTKFFFNSLPLSSSLLLLPSLQVLAVIAVISVRTLVPSVLTIARRESLNLVVNLPTLSLVKSASTLFASVVETLSTALFVWTLVPSPGPVKPSLARPVSSMSSTMPPTTNLSAPRPSSRAPSSKSMLLPSVNGTNLTTVKFWARSVKLLKLPKPSRSLAAC